MANNPFLTVSQLNRYVKSVLEEDRKLKDVYLKGEISNFVSHYKSGHLYFTLKEGGSAVKAVMFASYAKGLRFEPENGMAVILRCSVSLYERDGSYQIYVTELQPEGKGDLQLAFEQIHKKLKDEGCFNLEKKRPLPPYPERVGVITSANGAALQDILSILKRRYPAASIVFCPALVQGAGAPASLLCALEIMNSHSGCDVIILGRGGGSIEDLWAFNNEELARAVGESRIPIVSAVGHETDFTLCDFAADLRAPTPSSAAELVVPNKDDVSYTLSLLSAQIEGDLREILTRRKEQLHRLASKGCFQNPRLIWNNNTKKRIDLAKSVRSSIKRDILYKREQLRARATALDALNPFSRLASGYSVTYNAEGKIMKSVAETEPGGKISTRLADGWVYSTVEITSILK